MSSVYLDTSSSVSSLVATPSASASASSAAAPAVHTQEISLRQYFSANGRTYEIFYVHDTSQPLPAITQKTSALARELFRQHNLHSPSGAVYGIDANGSFDAQRQAIKSHAEATTTAQWRGFAASLVPDTTSLATTTATSSPADPVASDSDAADETSLTGPSSTTAAPVSSASAESATSLSAPSTDTQSLTYWAPICRTLLGKFGSEDPDLMRPTQPLTHQEKRCLTWLKDGHKHYQTRAHRDTSLERLTLRQYVTICARHTHE